MKRFLSWLLTAVMLCAVCAVPAVAEEAEIADGPAYTNEAPQGVVYWEEGYLDAKTDFLSDGSMETSWPESPYALEYYLVVCRKGFTQDSPYLDAEANRNWMTEIWEKHAGIADDTEKMLAIIAEYDVSEWYPTQTTSVHYPFSNEAYAIIDEANEATTENPVVSVMEMKYVFFVPDLENMPAPTALPLPTETPEPEPTEEPTPEPTEEPTPEPTEEPTPEPTEEPTPEPTEEPTPEPTEEPTPEPTEEPTPEPTEEPTPEPTEEPTPEPTEEPTPEPTEEPTPEPTEEPTPEPTEEPTPEPTEGPVDVKDMPVIGRVRVTHTGVVNVRAEADADSEVVEQYFPDSRMDVVGQAENGWYQIILKDGESLGYISNKLVKFTPSQP